MVAWVSPDERRALKRVAVEADTSVADLVRSLASGLHHGVVSADDVTGPYDVIARAESDSVDELGKMVVSRIQMIDGITRTLTCPVVNL